MWYQKKGSKYGAKSTEYGGQVYHSKLEAGRAAELDLLVRAGEIVKWERQVRISFDLCPRCKKLTSVNCSEHPLEKLFHLTNYYVDFKIYHKDGTIEFEEVKGIETSNWKLKWKLMECLYGDDETIKLTVIK